MKMTTTFFRSKVARRIVLLFVSCALLPVTILAVVSFYGVSSQLREESQKELAQASKRQGMAIYERLEFLDSDLQVLASQVREHRSPATGQTAQSHFSGLSVFTATGKQLAHWGNPVIFPRLTSAEQQHLLSGNSLLQIVNSDRGTPDLYLFRLVDPRQSEGLLVVGEPDSDYLWTARSLSPDLQFCVLSASRSVLFCSDDVMRSSTASPVFIHTSGLYEWKKDDTSYDASYWKLLVKPRFLQEPLTVAVSMEHEQAVAPMLRFRRIFPLVALLSIWVVLLASMMQIRRTLGPLEKLQDATHKIAARQFGCRVEVDSDDEFETLADSFNSMTADLGRQFHTLRTIHEIDQAIFASLDREAIADSVLAHMPSLFPSDSFGVCIFDDSRSSGWIRFRAADTGQLQTGSAKVAATDWLQLQNNTVSLTVAGNDRVPEYLLPLSQDGMRSFLVLPIRVENSLRAALVCAHRSTQVPAFENLQGARQVADQLAVAFSHVSLIKALEQLHWAALTALARAIDAKSQWTAGHSERVTSLAVEIGTNMGLSQKDLQIMQMGGLLHDIGKIGTPPSILDKPGKLTSDETRVMQDHVRTGVRILEPIPSFREALPIVSQHHEWFNGMGYPEGIAGQDISIYARIFAVADCYDAITSDRPYRKGLPKDQVLALLREKSGSQFDPDVIEVFARMMGQEEPQRKAEAASAGQFAK